MALAAGTRFGPYEIVGPLGEGGMGEVYRARDPRLNRQVALKLLPENVAADPERRARFLREGQSVAALNHPHIVAIYSVEEAGCIPHGLPMPGALPMCTSPRARSMSSTRRSRRTPIRSRRSPRSRTAAASRCGTGRRTDECSSSPKGASSSSTSRDGRTRGCCPSGGNARWLADGRRFVFSETSQIRLFDMTKRQETTLLTLKGQSVTQIALPSDNRMLYFLSNTSEGDVYMIEFPPAGAR